MNDWERVARRVSAACAELRDEAIDAGLDGVAIILMLAIVEADQHLSPPTAPAE